MKKYSEHNKNLSSNENPQNNKAIQNNKKGNILVGSYNDEGEIKVTTPNGIQLLFNDYIGDHRLILTAYNTNNIKGTFSLEIPTQVKVNDTLHTVIYIDDDALQFCQASELTLPAMLQGIGERALIHMNNLKKLTIPATVTKIHKTAFILDRMEVECESDYFTKKDGVLYTSDMMEIVYVERNNEHVKLADGLVEISAFSFIDMPELRSVEIPNSVVKIGKRAFSNCENLESVTLPPNLHRLGTDAFFDCKQLKEITLPVGIREIKDGVFQGCESLRKITIEGVIKHIGFNTFNDCKQLTDIELKEGLLTIDAYAFQGCSSLTIITIPSTLHTIPDALFSDCTELNEVVFKGAITKIGKYAFYNCSRLLYFTHPEENQAVEDKDDIYKLPPFNIFILPEGVKEIGDSAFSDCCINGTVVLPQSLERIGDHVFKNCWFIHKLVIPENVKHIGISSLYMQQIENHSPEFVETRYGLATKDQKRIIFVNYENR